MRVHAEEYTYVVTTWLVPLVTQSNPNHEKMREWSVVADIPEKKGVDESACIGDGTMMIILGSDRRK